VRRQDEAALRHVRRTKATSAHLEQQRQAIEHFIRLAGCDHGQDRQRAAQPPLCVLTRGRVVSGRRHVAERPVGVTPERLQSSTHRIFRRRGANAARNMRDMAPAEALPCLESWSLKP